ncbi:MAG: hypothetical protein A2Y25_04170 [Candidatus Melainabacteria bacterium GWF2_37_15]|nr:MAG: hypothetical protein A2Y25_04170 [Candidatus Melainabacteria bacterium GWF2_37_15]
MKIEDKKNNDTNNFLAAFVNMLNVEMLKIQPDNLPNNAPDFKTVLSGLGKTQNAKSKIPTLNLDSMRKEDIQFLKLCAEKTEISIDSITPKDMQVSYINPQEEGVQQVSYKTLNFSKGLFNLVEYSFNTQKPVRLSFEGDSAVILKINTDGKLTAEFISNDAAMEYALKSSIPALKQKMDAEGLPYEEIYYRDDNKNQNKNKRDKGGNK